MAVTYAEMQGYPTGRWADGDFYGKRRLKVAWSDASALLEELENTSWPYADGPNLCTPWQAIIKPFPHVRMDGTNSIASYDWAMIDVDYTTKGPVWNDTLSISVYETTSPYTRVHKIKADSKLYWDATCETGIDYSPICEWHGLKYKLTFSGLDSAPTPALDYIRYVNSNDVGTYTLGLSFPAETLMFAGATVDSKFNWGKLARYSVTYNFIYWPAGHNKMFRPGSGFVDVYYKNANGDGVLYEPYGKTLFSF